MGKNNLRVADFFCGAGGFSEGFRQKGFNVVFALDNWAPAKLTHDLNHPECHCELMNILELNTPEKIDSVVPDTEIIIGSPPCVSFSGSNKAGKADKSLGIKLIKAYLGVVAWKLKKGTCKYWVMENVPNSENYIQDSYTWDELGLPGGKEIAIEIPVKKVLNAAYYGAPQTRKRFVCGNYPMPEPTHDESNWVTIGHVHNHLPNPLHNQKPTEVIDPVYGFKIPADKLTDHFYDSSVAEYEWARARRLKEDHGFMGKMSFPENTNRPSRTVMATMSASTRESMILEGANEPGKEYRLPTIREISSFMSFPITYQFEGTNVNNKYKLIGNAVCSKLSAALAESIAKQEGIEVPDFLHLPEVKPSVDLTGIKRKPKLPKPRKEDSKFSIHVPYLKIRSIRVELSNKESDFKNKKFKWDAKIHYGSGKSAKFAELSLTEIEKAFKGDKDFKRFQKVIKNKFKNFKLTANELQESHVMNGNSPNLNPEMALKRIREGIDEIYSYEDFKDKFVENTHFESIERKEIPFLVLVSAWACQYFVSLIR